MVFCSLSEEAHKSTLRILAEVELILGQALMLVTSAESDNLATKIIDCKLQSNTVSVALGKRV